MDTSHRRNGVLKKPDTKSPYCMIPFLDVQNQTKLTYDDGGQNRGHPW